MRMMRRPCARWSQLCILINALLIASAPMGAEVDLSSRPLDSSALIERIALGSCFRESRIGHRVWRSILARDPQLFLYMGDTLYPRGRHNESTPAELQRAYEQLAAVAPFAELRQQVPVLPVWDDHDYGLNDGGADYRQKLASEALFESSWGLGTEDPRRSRPGIYHAVTVGPVGRRVQVIVLDTRYFRSPLMRSDDPGARGKERYQPDDDPAKTMLGAGQWAWLEEQLSEPVELRLLVSTVQVLADGHGWEGWRQLPRERQRLLELLARNSDTPTLLLSGDRHVAGFYRVQNSGGPALAEFTSSALNNTIPQAYRSKTVREAGPNRLGGLYGKANFGTLAIDWQAAQVRLAIHNSAGRVVRELDWAFDGKVSDPH